MMATETRYTDEDIIEGIKKSDSKVIEYLYRLFYESAERMFSSLPYGPINPEDFKDIAQESFVLFITKVNNDSSDKFLLNNKVSILTYLLTLFKYQLLAQKRKNLIKGNLEKEYNLSEDIVTLQEPPDSLKTELTPNEEQLNAALIKLTEKERALFLMLYSGAKMTEIASELNISINSLHNLRYRLLNKLRNALKLVPREGFENG